MAPKVSFVIFGASGDLAHRKTFPALLRLFIQGDLDFLTTKVIGFARSDMTKESFAESIQEEMEKPSGEGPSQKAYEQLLSEVEYVRAKGGYDGDESYIALGEYLEEVERERDVRSAISSHSPDVSAGAQGKHLRVFYLAIPPNMFGKAAELLRKYCWSDQTTNRIMIEKPYGMDLSSAKELSATLGKLFNEEDIYRVDHYLAKDILKQLLAFRFSTAGSAFDSLFHHNRVSYVTLDFKEDVGIEGRGGYFDQAGIIRDVAQNHVINLLIFATMEHPKSLTVEELVAARLELIKAITTVRPEDVLIGQYTASLEGSDKRSYLDDLGTKEDSKTPTYAACVFYINNSRWHGVPFILRAGKALDEHRVELSLHFKRNPGALFTEPMESTLVIRSTPTESIEFHIAGKKPGYSQEIIPATLGLEISQLAPAEYRPLAYEALFREAIVEGNRLWFVGKEEAEALWRIWDRYLSEVDGKEEPYKYPRGSQGPIEVEEFIMGYIEERRRLSASEFASAMAAEVGRIVEQGKEGMHRMLRQVGIEE